jgi:hypothetical protein
MQASTFSRMRWAGDVMWHVREAKEMRVYRRLVEKPEGKKTVGRPRNRCEDNRNVDLKVNGGEGVEWLYLA